MNTTHRLPWWRHATRLAVSVVGAATLAVAVAMPGVSAATHANRPHTTPTHNLCSRSALDVPSCGVLWGLYTPHQNYSSLEKAIGRQFDIVKNYVDWRVGSTFPTARAEALAANGARTLDFSWNAINYKTGAKISYQSIANGDWDKSVILPEAQHLKSFHHKVFLDFNHEFDNRAQAGHGTPAQYIAAYRHIHQVMASAGVTNVIWVWVSTGYLGHKQQIQASYPGSAYVDWVGYDPYNFAKCHSESWKTPYQRFEPFYNWLQLQSGMKNKPIMLGEYASSPGPAVQAWYAAVAPALQRLPKIKAVMQFNSGGTSVCDFRLSDSAAALAGFTTSSNADYILGVTG